jgi:hypothetical protein
VIQSSNSRDLRSSSQEEEFIFNHVMQWLENHSSSEIIDNFRRLFIEGKEATNSKVFLVLEQLIKSKNKEQLLSNVLSRCSRIILYFWDGKAEDKTAITSLMDLFLQIPPVKHRGYHSSFKLQQLVRDFTKTEEYRKLKILANLLAKTEIDDRENCLLLENLIQRYPFLYEHYLLDENSIYEDWQTVQKLQARNQQLSEFNLSQYIIYKVRLIQLARSGQISERTIRQINNPTFLKEPEVSTAVTTFKIKKEANVDYKTLSQRLLINTKESSYQVFKEELYKFLITSIDPKYGQHTFNHKFHHHLQNIFSDSNSKKIDELLLMRTCDRLLNFLIVDNSQQLNHYIFIDLVTHSGVTNTVGLLLKIALICPKIKPKLEKKFAILFEHYKNHKIEDVPWLLKSLENLQIAFSIHFGKLDLSVFKIL